MIDPKWTKLSAAAPTAGWRNYASKRDGRATFPESKRERGSKIWVEVRQQRSGEHP